MAILRIPAVLTETGYRSRGSVYTAIKDGLFTNPVRLSERSIGWPDTEIKAINAARIAGKTNEEIKTLVAKLHRNRLTSCA